MQTQTRLNIEQLKGVLAYFYDLNANGEISDRAFKALVRQACANFVENEVEQRISETLEQKFEQFWLKQHPSLERYFST